MLDSADKIQERVDSETGEVFFFKASPSGHEVPVKNYSQVRSERWQLKSVVNSLFPESRTSKCSKLLSPSFSHVQLLLNHDSLRAHYGGLIRCASVWLCPVCAAQIAERRRAELVVAVETAKRMGFYVYLVTFTFPHGIGDDLSFILEKMAKAWKQTTSTRWGSESRKILELVGTIRALEGTYGMNGFHPHFHVLFFTRKNWSPEGIRSLMTPIWQRACLKADLPRPSDYRGVHVDDGSRAAYYASKWGLEDEMTKGHIKTSKGVKGMSPWDFLRDILANDSEESKRLFSIYANAFRGRKQLYWSVGLKKLLLVEEKTDEQLIDHDVENSDLLAELTIQQWRLVLRHRCESALLDIAERNPGSLFSFIAGLYPLEASHV